MKIKDIMSKVVCVDIDTTLEGVVEQMAKEDVNSVMVVNDKSELIGTVDIVTLMNTIVPEYIGKRDASVAKFTSEGVFENFINDNKDKKVKYFMHEVPKTISESSSMLDACMITTEGRQTRIPVLDNNNKPIGIITRRGVKSFLAQKMGF